MQKNTDYAKGSFYIAVVAVIAIIAFSAAILYVVDNQEAPVVEVPQVNESALIDAILAGIPEQGLSAEEVANLIKTDGEGVYKVSDSEAAQLREFVEDEDPDFVEMFAAHVDVDEDYLKIKSIDRKDTEVTADTEDDKDDENYNVAVFYKIKYKDVDEDDYDYAYILVETQYDEGDLDEDEVVITEVERDFEF